MLRRIPAIGVGTLLIVAALLKLHSFLFAPFEPQFLLPLRWQQLALIELEALLGVWLLSGQAWRFARWAGFLFFTAAAGASIYLAISGQSSCGCFGQVQASPRVALAIDLAALVGLVLARGKPSESFVSPLRSMAVRSVLGSLVILGLAFELFFLTVREPEQVLARWRGEIIGLEPGVIDAGSQESGTQRAVSIRVHNYSRDAIEIVGGSSTCACVAIESLPVKFQPGTYADIQILINYKGSPGHFVHQFVLYTDHPSARVVYVTFRGEVTAKAPTPAHGTCSIEHVPDWHNSGGEDEFQIGRNRGYALLHDGSESHARGTAPLSSDRLRRPRSGKFCALRDLLFRILHRAKHQRLPRLRRKRRMRPGRRLYSLQM